MQEPEGVTRPKIHRLPPKEVKSSELYVSRTVAIVCVALLLVVVLPALWSLGKSTKTPAEQNRQAASAPGTPAPSDNETIAVHDEKGQMVGELAKMPADLDRTNSINSTSKIDPESGKELLSIIGKY